LVLLLADTVSGSVWGLDPAREARVATGGMFRLENSPRRHGWAVLERKT
jgi:hypothetical protein